MTPIYPLPKNEVHRLEVLNSYDVLGPTLGPQFDDLLRLAQRIFNVPIVLLSFVAADKQVFGARIGLDACEASREGSFCTHTILGPQVLAVPDAHADPLFAASPFVTGPPFIRFYAGAPLIAPEGHAIGSLCIVDPEPRADFSLRESETLDDLARLAMERLEARRAKLRELDRHKGFEAVMALSPDAIITADSSNHILSWNRAAELTFGYTADDAVGRPLSIIVPAHLRSRHETGLATVAAGRQAKLAGQVVRVPALRADGAEFPAELSLTYWQEEGAHRFGAIIRDVSDRVATEERLKREAALDHLTGIPNRKALEAAMEDACEQGSTGALLILDLDGFKDVNDSLGHVAGDKVLREVARRLSDQVAELGLVARMGGDEFAVFLRDGASRAASLLGQRLVTAIERPIELGKRGIYIGASGGVALSDGAPWDPDTLISDADLALYQAKADGRGGVCAFSRDMRSLAQTRSSVSSGLREAWEQREFEMYFQPQVRLEDRAIAGAEALIRWNHPERGLTSPAAFLSALETSLIVGPVASWILRTACAQARRCRALGLSDFRMGVNLFSAQFRSGDLPRQVADALASSGLPPSALELEVTENTILQNDGRIVTQLTELRAMGVGVAFDDYGTGYASLTMLKDFPVTRLKIDRSFVSGVHLSPQDQTIVEAVAKLAHGFRLDVIAEGIETEVQAKLMTSYCREGQGYLFGRPMTGEQLESLCSAAPGSIASPDAHFR